MVGVLPKRLLATAASSPAVERLLATAASSPAAARLLLTAASSPSSARLLSTAASSASAARFLSTAASSPAAARVRPTASSSPATTRLLATVASSPAATREIAVLLPLSAQGMFRSGEGCSSGIKGALLLGNLTNPQAARFMDKDLRRELTGDHEHLDSMFTKSYVAGGIPVEEDKDNKIDDKTEDDEADDLHPTDDDTPLKDGDTHQKDDDGNGSGGGGNGGYVNDNDPPPPENGGKGGNNGGKSSSCFENHILYEIGEMRKEMRANNWRLYKQSCRVQKEMEDFRKDIDDKIAHLRLLLANVALKFLISILLLLLAIAKLAAPYLKDYLESLWDQKVKDSLYGDLVGKKDPPVKKP